MQWQLQPGILSRAALDGVAAGGTPPGGGAAASAMLPDVFVNSDGTARQANANGVMVNLPVGPP